MVRDPSANARTAATLLAVESLEAVAAELGAPPFAPLLAAPRARLTGMEPLPSRSALVRIGKALAAGTETDAQLDLIDAVLDRCDEVRRSAAELLTESLAHVVSDTGGQLSVRGRTKTLITLREKLARMGGHQLPVIRDLVGLRIVGDMTLDDQDLVLWAAGAALDVDQADIKIIDRRAAPVRGYRALHGEVVLEGIRVEIQVRTVLQHEWAEVYERIADRFGRSVRYLGESGESRLGDEEQEILRAMSTISAAIAAVEEENWALTTRRLLDRSEAEKAMQPPSRPVGAVPVERDGAALADVRKYADAVRRLSTGQQDLVREMLTDLSSMLERSSGGDGS